MKYIETTVEIKSVKVKYALLRHSHAVAEQKRLSNGPLDLQARTQSYCVSVTSPVILLNL